MLLPLLPLLPLLFIPFEGQAVYGDVFEISNVKALVNFSESVNSGTNYAGTTVLLTADIVFDDELSGEFVPIGKDSSNYFQGSFNSQGYGSVT